MTATVDTIGLMSREQPRQLDTVGDPKLLEDAVKVVLNTLLSQAEAPRNLPIAAAICHQPRNLQLSPV
jgi:hypothetical protein